MIEQSENTFDITCNESISYGNSQTVTQKKSYQLIKKNPNKSITSYKYLLYECSLRKKYLNKIYQISICLTLSTRDNNVKRLEVPN